MKILCLLTLLATLSAQQIKTELDSFEKISLELNAKTQIEFGDRHSVEIDGSDKELKYIEYEVRNGTLRVWDRRKNKGFNFNITLFGSKLSNEVRVKIITKKLVSAAVSGGGETQFPLMDQNKFELDHSGSTDLFLGGKIGDFYYSKSGSGDVEITDLESENVEIDKSGSGDIELDGHTKQLNIETSGSGKIRWQKLSAKFARVEMSGSGDLKFSGEIEKLQISKNGSGEFEGNDLTVKRCDISMSGSGDVELLVEEELDASLSGSGDLKYTGRPDIRKSVSGSGEVRRR